MAGLSAAFFIWRMRADPLAVAYGACVVYFTPGFFGIALFSYGAGLSTYSEPIVPAAYTAMTLVFAVLTATAFAVDRIPSGPKIRLAFDAKIAVVLLVFVTIAGAVSIRNTNVYYLCVDKLVVLGKIDAWYYYASFSIPFAVAIGLVLRWWPVVLIGVICMLGDLYAGFRVVAAITFVACAIVMEDRIRQGWWNASVFAAILLVGGAALFMVKHLIVPAKYVTASYCDAQLAADAKSAAQKRAPAQPAPAGQVARPKQAEKADAPAPEPARTAGDVISSAALNLTRSRFYFSAFVAQNEAFVIQSILNEVVRKDLHTGSAYLVNQVLAGVPLGTSLFGIDSSKVVPFNTMMQPVLFPGVSFAMANNPWAQAYAAGGQWMVAIFAIGYALIAGLLSLLFRTTDGALRAAVAVTCVWTGFYFHRNDLFIEIVLIKHVVYVFGAAVAVAWAWNWISPAKKPVQDS